MKMIAHMRANPPTAPPMIAPKGVEWSSSFETAVVLAAAALPVVVDADLELDEGASVEVTVLDEDD